MMQNRKKNILIVEDDDSIAHMIEAALIMGNYESSICDNGVLALELIQKQTYDLVLLDVMLPGMDGFTIIEKIENRDVAVIFITAKQEVSDRVRGLKLGADDYIVKPFDAMELLARIEAVLRRCGTNSETEEGKVQYGSIMIDESRHEVRLENKIVALTPKEYEVFLYFLHNQNIVIRKERLIAKVWGYDYEGESRTVDTHIQNLRKKLQLKDALVTIPKIGYCLKGELDL